MLRAYGDGSAAAGARAEDDDDDKPTAAAAAAAEADATVKGGDVACVAERAGEAGFSDALLIRRARYASASPLPLTVAAPRVASASEG